MAQGAQTETRLVLLCGLPASGKTTLARELADAYGAVRLNPDEWELALGVDPFNEGFQVRLETAFWELAQRLLALGTSGRRRMLFDGDELVGLVGVGLCLGLVDRARCVLRRCVDRVEP